MEVNHNYQPMLQAYPTFDTPSWDKRLAWWISNIGSPPVMAVLGLLLCAYAAAMPSAWVWAGFAILFTIMLPALYIVWLVRQGKVTDFDLIVREQRIRPFMVTTASTLITWLTLRQAAAPPPLVILAGAALAQTVLMMLITLRWKISSHAAAAAGLAVVAWMIIGQAAAPLFLSVPVIAWSRVRLSRHDLLQTVGGALLGITTMAAAFYLGG